MGRRSNRQRLEMHPPGEISLQQALDHVFRLFGDVVFLHGEDQGLIEDFLAHLGEVAVVKRRPSGEQFKAHDAEGPPVHLFAVARAAAAVHNHLWREVLGGAAEGGCGRFHGAQSKGGNSFGQAEVRQLDVAILVQQHVLWLQITVHNRVGVQMRQSQRNLGGIKAHHALGEAPQLLQVEEQLTSWTVIRHHVQLMFRLEGIAQCQDERVGRVRQY
mmetsp:Transcript_41763/g.72484  ORF Transcript_41763/g.72484 Transcript_41763/m.72484 type:complete len:216 (-) Transcript_41763:370-1017(-)